ncbi:MAG: PKD domain-containing protein [Bacteroidota bacterium]
MQFFKTNIYQLSLFCALLLIGLTGCDERFTLPEEGSVPDATPPEAAFSASQDEANPLVVRFSNLSISATDYSWDFGDGNTSTDAEPSHEYAKFGNYEVSLTVSDKLGQASTYSEALELNEPVVVFEPEILNPGFDIEGADSYRDNWRNGDLGGVLQITSSPIHEGVKAAKFPDAGDRIAYQLITVEKEKDYIVSFYYTIKTSPVGSMTVSILAGDVTDPAAVAGATINSVTVNDQSDANAYVLASVSFNSGDNTEVAIYVSNEGAECRLDTFTIVED